MPRGGVRRGKPTKLKIIQGTFRPDRAPRDEPKPIPIAPGPPEKLSPFAKVMWERLAPKLEKLGLLTEIDDLAFFLTCEAWARWRESCGRRSKILRRYKDPVHRQVRLAEISVEKAEQSFRLLANEFGLSPAARSRLRYHLPMLNEEDEFEEFLGGRKPR